MGLRSGVAQDSRPRPRIAVRIAVPLTSLAIGLLALEGAARGLLPTRPLTPHYVPDLLQVEWLDVPGGGRTFRFRPNQSVAHCFDRTVGRADGWDELRTAPDGTPLGCVRYTIDEGGFRAPSTLDPGAPNAPRIVVLGDSFTFGDAVPANERFTRYLADALAERGTPARVENRGLQGLNTAGALGVYRALVRSDPPEHLVLAIVPNDAQDFRATLDDGAFSRIAPWRPLVPPLWQRSRLADAVVRGLATLGSSARTIEHVTASFAGESGARFRATLAALVAEARRDGVQPHLVLFPMTPALRGPGTPYPFEALHRELAAEAEKLDVPLLDLEGAVRDWPPDRLWAHPTDPHPSIAFHRLAGHLVADALGDVTPDTR